MGGHLPVSAQKTVNQPPTKARTREEGERERGENKAKHEHIKSVRDICKCSVKQNKALPPDPPPHCLIQEKPTTINTVPSYMLVEVMRWGVGGRLNILTVFIQPTNNTQTHSFRLHVKKFSKRMVLATADVGLNLG